MTREDFTRFQKQASLLLSNSIKKNHLSTAYLLYGNSTAPLRECAYFFAKSINCTSRIDNLACEKCSNCLQSSINSENLTDRNLIHEINKDFNLIKREDTDEIRRISNLTNTKNDAKTIFIINFVENIVNKAANAILKCIEEPHENQIYILTTKNIASVLPTIKSRCVSVAIENADSRSVYLKLKNENPIYLSERKSYVLNEFQMYYLSKFFTSYEEIIDNLSKDDAFLNGSKFAEDILNSLVISTSEAACTIINNSIMKDDNKSFSSKVYNWMYLVLHKAFDSILLDDIEDYSPLYEQKDKLELKTKSIKKADNIIKNILKDSQMNLNRILASSKIAYALIEEN